MNLTQKTLAILLMGVGMVGMTHAAGNVEAGKAKAAQCAGCHGADGNSPTPMFPKLAGQNARYISKQLNDIKKGARSVPVMAGIAAGLSDQDIEDVAAYFSSQKMKTGQANKDLVALGEKTYRAGNAAAGLPACSGCHGAAGDGLAEAGFPRLAGQHADYVKVQLEAFRSAGRGDATGTKRTNDGDTQIMRSVAAKLSDSEIAALSSYVSGLYK
ncbi:MAG TPA: c-type cytochrome [Pseudomonadales bacterium]|nr:c-type cytochrome [Pseudomonadales bacterium]